MQTESTVIKIQGMICRACTDAVAQTITQTRGVVDAKVRYLKGEALVEYDPAIIDPALIAERVERSGYPTGARGVNSYLTDLVCAALCVLLVWILLKSPLNPVPEAKAGMDFGYVFLIGLLTSTHCVAMCGGILLSQTTEASLQAKRSDPLRGSLRYNGGRLLSYTVMGAVFGAVGTVITYTQDVKSMVFTLLGLAVAVLGLNMWGLIPGLGALLPRQTGACSVPGNTRRRFAGRPLIVGMLTGLMPCGPLYALWLAAMGTGSARSGAVTMLAFALGTVPLMLLFGSLGSLIQKQGMKYMLKLSAVLVTAMGVKMLIRGLMLL